MVFEGYRFRISSLKKNLKCLIYKEVLYYIILNYIIFQAFPSSSKSNISYTVNSYALSINSLIESGLNANDSHNYLIYTLTYSWDKSDNLILPISSYILYILDLSYHSILGVMILY